MHIPDPTELGERRIEDWAFDSVNGNVMTCPCGKTCDINQAETLSPDPYAIPVCPDCFDDYMSRKFGENWKDKI